MSNVAEQLRDGSLVDWEAASVVAATRKLCLRDQAVLAGLVVVVATVVALEAALTVAVAEEEASVEVAAAVEEVSEAVIAISLLEAIEMASRPLVLLLGLEATDATATVDTVVGLMVAAAALTMRDPTDLPAMAVDTVTVTVAVALEATWNPSAAVKVGMAAIETETVTATAIETAEIVTETMIDPEMTITASADMKVEDTKTQGSCAATSGWATCVPTHCQRHFVCLPTYHFALFNGNQNCIIVYG